MACPTSRCSFSYHNDVRRIPLLWSLLLFGTPSSLWSSAALQQQGSAARPALKKNIAVLGCGGYMGAMTFGFLQRACSLYGTGMGQYRCIGATAETSIRLNRVLSKRFVLAMADESKVKLTNLESVDAVRQSLDKYDALILGTNMLAKWKPVSLGTFEKTPNDKTWEVFWNPPSDAIVGGGSLSIEQMASTTTSRLLDNILQGAKAAGVQHLVVVADGGPIDPILLMDCGIPYTCIHPTGELTIAPDYSYQKGILSDLDVSSDANVAATWGQHGQVALSREDLAAFCVQCLQSLDWATSRSIFVQSRGLLDPTVTPPIAKRLDEEWCAHSYRLENALVKIS